MRATPFGAAYSIIILSISCDGGQQVPRMVPNPILRYYALPVYHGGVVPESKDSRIRYLRR